MSAADDAELAIESGSLSQVVSSLVQKWRAEPNSGSEQDHMASDRGRSCKQRPDPVMVSPHLVALAAAESSSIGCAMDHAALGSLLSDIGLAAVDLKSETLLSLILRLEDRPGCLARLKDLGVCVLPHRQKIANALAKAKRNLAPSGTLPPVLPPSSVFTESVSATCGYLCTARGRVMHLNGRSAMLAEVLAIEGPVMCEVARFAALAGFTVVVIAPQSPVGGVAPLAAALGCPKERLHVLRTARRHTEPTEPAGEPPGVMPTFDALVAPIDPDDRRAARRRVQGRQLRAVWRGGRGDGDESRALRERLVHFCSGRHDLFDVGFKDEAPALSQRQQGSYRVRLLLCSDARWDRGWLSALTSGCVLLVVGDWLPSIPELRAWDHFVPALSDLSDLVERVEWALHNDVDATAMAERSRSLGALLAAPGHLTRCLAGMFAELACDDRLDREAITSHAAARAGADGEDQSGGAGGAAVVS